MANLFSRMVDWMSAPGAEFKALPAPAAIVAPDAQAGVIVSLDVGPMGAYTMGPRYNPDDLIGKKGMAIYHKMRHDEQVKAVCNFKRDAILSRGWMLVYDEESKLSEEERATRVRILTKILERLRGSFSDALNVVSTGREFGFSLTEKVYAPVKIDGQDWSGLQELLGRDPASFEFNTDEYGRLKYCEQLAGGRRIPIDLKKFIYYVHAPEFDAYFGRSDLRAAYRSWYFKDAMIKYWGLYMEKLGGGFLKVQAMPGGQAPAMNSAQYAQLLAVLRDAKASASIVLPDGLEGEVVFPQSTDAFEQVCTWHDLAIARALLVPNLLGVSHTGQTGAYSQSQTQIEAFAWTIKADAERLADTITEDLIADLVARNWDDEEAPRFTFKPLSEERLKWVIETWCALVAAGMALPTEIDEKRLRELLDMPVRDEDTELLVDPNKEKARQDELAVKKIAAEKGVPEEKPPGGGAEAGAKKPPAKFGYNPDQERADDHVDREMDYAVSVGGAKRDKGTALRILKDIANSSDERVKARDKREANRVIRQLESGTYKGDEDFSHAKNRGELETRRGAHPVKLPFDKRTRKSALQLALFTAAERVDFAVVERRQTTMANALTADVAATVARAVARIMGTDAHLAKLTDEDVSDIAKVGFSGAERGRLKGQFQHALSSAWSMGQQMALNELERIERKKMARVNMTDLRDVASQYFEANGFRMAGSVSDGARAMIQQELQNSVKMGRSPDQTRQVIWARLQARGFSSADAIREVETNAGVLAALNELWVDSEAEAAAYLNTLARTNLFEAMNEARYAEFTDPELDGFVLAFRYSAVLDERTTEICQALHDRVYKATSEVWDTYRPPNHFNCRSVLIPITEVDGFDPADESEEPDVEPQEGFK